MQNLSGKWWDRGLVVVRGCTPVSAGCDHCWAARLAHRFRHLGDTDRAGRFAGKIKVNLSALKQLPKTGKPLRVALWNDVLHDDVGDDDIARIVRYIARSQHTFIILTKRACGIQFLDTVLVRYQRQYTPIVWPLPNLWVGISAEDYLSLVQRVCGMRILPVTVRFICYEPVLGKLDLQYELRKGTFNWVIAGAETGPGARPAKLDWFRLVRDQAKVAGVPFWLKAVDAKGNRELDGRTWEELPTIGPSELPG